MTRPLRDVAVQKPGKSKRARRVRSFDEPSSEGLSSEADSVSEEEVQTLSEVKSVEAVSAGEVEEEEEEEEEERSEKEGSVYTASSCSIPAYAKVSGVVYQHDPYSVELLNRFVEEEEEDESE